MWTFKAELLHRDTLHSFALLYRQMLACRVDSCEA